MRLTILRAAIVGVCWMAGACGDDAAEPVDATGGSAGSASGGSTSGGSGGSATGGVSASGGTAGSASGGLGADGGIGGSAGSSCENSLDVDATVPDMLSRTGLYADIETKQLGAGVAEFAPQFALWSDAAEKARWVYIPECESIDTTDMDDWRLPVGSRLWKEFSVGGKRIETRLIVRTGLGPQHFEYATYQWNAGETEAERVPLGVVDALGTDHDIPSQDACRRCHGTHADKGGRPSRSLGFSALQLAHTGGGVTLQQLIDDGKLTSPPATVPVMPGDATEQAALGYLHANCGHCHNSTSDGIPQVDLNFWIDVDQTTVESTSTYASAVGKPNQVFNDQNVAGRIVPGDPDHSSVIYRMNLRGASGQPNTGQMPPLATEMVDTTGSAAVRTWIEGLTP